jgi:hypothetical protein
METPAAGQEDEEPALLALLAGDDATAIGGILRGYHTADVTAIATGSGFIHSAPRTAPWRLVSVAEIPVSAAARAAAARAIDLRRQGEDIVCGALAALGHAYHGTEGWPVVAFAAPGGQIGFVNTAKGIAVLTSATLSPEVTEALTVPEQPEGPQLSAAASWAGPDPGEAHRASAPQGWAQLLLDLRGGGEPARNMTARITAWCLTTCYGNPGEPGHLSLDPPLGAETMDPRDWPCSEETRAAMDEAGYAALDKIARDLAAQAGLAGHLAAALGGDEPRNRRVSAAMRAAHDPRERQITPPYSPVEEAVRSAVGIIPGTGTAADALGRANVSRLAHACGDTSENNISGNRYHDLIDRLLRRILAGRLTPAAADLAAHFEGERQMWTGKYSLLFPTFSEALTPVAAALADRALAAATIASAEALDAMTGIYHADGPVAVSIPLHVPGHLPWNPGEPVGLEEISARLRVARATVDQWRARGVLPAALPGPVGGRPAWPWRAIEEWAARTGRLPQP